MNTYNMSIWTMLLLAAFEVNAGGVDLKEAALRGIVTDPSHEVAPGCAIGVFDVDHSIITGAGMADVADARPITENTLFYAASVSKQFTALAIAQLVVAGKLKLTDDVHKYIPELPKYDAPVTIAMLLHHTSGIRDWIGLMQLAGRDAAAEDAEQVALKLVLGQKATNFMPGTQFLYSNGAFLLLAKVVENVSGLPFHEYEKRFVLDPIGMRDSYFLHGANPAPNTVAHGYVPKGNGFAIRDTYPRFGGSGGLIVSMNDLAHYYHDIRIGHKVWTAEISKIMLAPGKFNDGVAVKYEPGGIMGYASGLAVGERRGRFMVEHGGAADGFKNEFGWFPQIQLGVGVLCNRGDWDPLQKFDAVVDQVRPGLLASVSPDGLRGTYRSDELGASYIIEPDNGALRLTIVPASGAPATTMMMHRAKSAGYEVGYEGLGMHLTPDVDGKGVVVGTDRAQGVHLDKVSAK